MDLQIHPRDRTIAVSASALARLLALLNPNPDDPNEPHGPGGPVIRGGRAVRLLRELLGRDPGHVSGPGDPEPWRYHAVGAYAADRLVDVAQITNGPGQQEVLQQRLAEFVDDFCGTPPRVRWPWPGPKRDLSVNPAEQVLVGVQFLTAAGSIEDPLVASAVADAGERIAQTGFARLGDGTLGGLVQEARHIEAHLGQALRMAALCSNDPICAHHAPGTSLEDRWLLGAACHGCALIAETSCEMRNDYLDRALVLSVLGIPDAGFFPAPA
jgi:hypothetical protein